MEIITSLYEQWWEITVMTYEFIWPAIPFAIAFGIWRGWRRNYRA